MDKRIEVLNKQRKFLSKMSDLNHSKARARGAGFAGSNAVNYPQHLKNGQVVEIAVCHLMGIMQRHVDYRLSVYMSRELDMEGVDLKIVTPYGTKDVQMKHASTLGSRRGQRGEYLVPVEVGGYKVTYNFFKYYKLPWPRKSAHEYQLLIDELNEAFAAYTDGMYY